MENIEQYIVDYKPSQDTIDLVRGTKIVLLVGVTGAGKNTIKNELLTQPNFCDVVSHTNRAPRMNDGVMETPDIEYHFIDQAVAFDMIQQQQFVEVKINYGDTIYGTSVAEIQQIHDAGKIAVADIDIKGAEEYRVMSPDIKIIFILPPSYDVWLARLQNRYSTPGEFGIQWPKRRKTAIEEITRALGITSYYFVVNDNLTDTIRVVNKIVNGIDEDYSNDQARQVACSLLDNIISSDI